MKQKIFLMMGILLIWVPLYAQKDTTTISPNPADSTTTIMSFETMSLGGDNTLPFSIPESPEAQSFKIFGDYPVSHYTGMPDISIPIYNIRLKGLTVPITLAYHASGIKVDQVASWVGLGWNLQSGGVISRSINGIADEESGGILDVTRTDNYYPGSFENINYIETYGSGGNVEIPFLQSVKSGTKDSESDLYTLNAFGMNVKFILDSDANVHCLPKSNLDIEPISTSTLGWIVTDTKGNKFYFEETESSTSITKETDGGNPSPILVGSPVSGWYITKIITPAGEQILFDYQVNGSTQRIVLNETATFIPYGISDPDLPNDRDSHSFSEYEISYTVPVLNKITFPTGEMKFILNSSSREDTKGASYALNKIEIRNSSEILQKTFDFNYSYFQSAVPGGGTSNYLFKRLKLLSVTEKGSDGSSLSPYEFTYYTTYNLPGIYSCARDHWGYYNGSTGNDNSDYKLIPNKTYLSQFISGLEYNYFGADREPEFPEMMAWTLTNIKYPTGGKTEFQYEAHEYYKSGSGNKTAGGLRIKRIISHNTNEALPTFKEFTYLSSTGYSSALLNHNFLYALKFNNYVYGPCPTPQYGCDANVNVTGCALGQFLMPQSELYFSSSKNGLGLTKGSSVGYEKVQVKEGYKDGAQYITNNGKTEYTFKTTTYRTFVDNAPLSGFLGSTPVGCFPHFKATRFWEPSPFYPFIEELSNDWEEGLMLGKSVYDSSGNLLHSLSNEYSYGLDNEVIGKGLKICELPLIYSDQQFVPNIFYSKYTIDTDWYRLDKTIEKTYDNGRVLTKTTNYEYDNQYYLTTKSWYTDSKNNTISTYYYYPFDYTSTSYNISALKSKNIIAKPIDVRTYDGTQLISGQQIEYSVDGLPTDIYIAEPTGTDITFSTSNPYTFTHKKWYSYYNNSIRQILADDNFNTAYLWDATGNFLMAKVENGSFKSLVSEEGHPSTYSSKTLYNSLKALVPDALITTYSHKPLVGITQQTDPSGVTSYFDYDSFGRLSTVKNDDGKLLKKYDYHYAN